MRALVIFESMFGNTHDIATAVAAGLGEQLTVELLAVGDAPTAIPDDVDLVVVGGPTHAFGMTRPATRHSAVERAATPDSTGESTGIREWLAGLGRGTAAVAAFDTRIDTHGLPGSAARAAERRLRRLGYRSVSPATSFWVTDVTGPLQEGEADRARAWGAQMAALLRQRDVLAR